MVEDEKKRRAPAMTLEERRAAIVASTLPLLVEHGGAVSTSQIAAAAGIAEGTVFRAFKDKRELLVECMFAGLDATDEVGRIERIDPTLPMSDRLTEGVRTLVDYLGRIVQLGQAMQAAGIDRDAVHQRVHGRAGSEESDDKNPGPPREMVRVSRAVAALFDPDQLRLDQEHAARLLLGLVLTNRRMETGFGSQVIEPTELVDLFLHGVIRTNEGNHA
ncbi:TetR/AcrR family transcriptional regulator [Actinophytocola gossypii]|uniref:TetR family transcriptional regulator n=1 Tax=Actinophytocola gossypii TaxID=2812003 RepID=A0ABT2JGK9_9PSEU|nr:TetR family transcriptional regulator [Actinophytocola gossypii]MCT2586878.1 TetR family transcriptional regulator [Actinophytocola gossypii]